ncbi:hypothetical protein BaRGS_00020287 [Batillaria attramentaria]|uniref:Uncharacterized protein n=1 Tax=Batillaria attramentaria TaxID=370345 RepID=A0ABD0KNL0_9CAEN
MQLANPMPAAGNEVTKPVSETGVVDAVLRSTVDVTKGKSQGDKPRLGPHLDHACSPSQCLETIGTALTDTCDEYVSKATECQTSP